MLIPSFAKNIPSRLAAINPPASADEMDRASVVRQKFLYPGENMPQMTDIVRAFRLAHGASTYLEVGSRDKGNVAWVSERLADDAAIVEIDIDKNEQQEALLRSHIKPGQSLASLTGDCLSPETVAQIKSAFAGRPIDLMFLDTLHWYAHAVSEVAVYYELLAPGGVMFVHDAFFEGTDDGQKGKAWAFTDLAKFHPIYSVLTDEPVSHYMRRGLATEVWGGLAILEKPLAAANYAATPRMPYMDSRIMDAQI